MVKFNPFPSGHTLYGLKIWFRIIITHLLIRAAHPLYSPAASSRLHCPVKPPNGPAVTLTCHEPPWKQYRLS